MWKWFIFNTNMQNGKVMHEKNVKIGIMTQNCSRFQVIIISYLLLNFVIWVSFKYPSVLRKLYTSSAVNIYKHTCQMNLWIYFAVVKDIKIYLKLIPDIDENGIIWWYANSQRISKLGIRIYVLPLILNYIRFRSKVTSQINNFSC